MIDNTAHIEGDAGEDAASLWLGFLASPAAPKRAMSLLELDGYLTGVAVAPSLIRPGLWMASLWADEEPIFDDAAQIPPRSDATIFAPADQVKNTNVAAAKD